MRRIFIFSVLFVISANSAFASTVFTCGKNKGNAEKAEYLFSENLDGYSLRLANKEIPTDAYDVTAADESWIVTVYGKKNELDKKFVFSEKHKSVEEFNLYSDGREKKVENEKSCAVSIEQESEE